MALRFVKKLPELSRQLPSLFRKVVSPVTTVPLRKNGSYFEVDDVVSGLTEEQQQVTQG